MTDINSEERIAELEAQVEALREALEAQQECAQTKPLIDFTKVKSAIDDGSEYVINAMKPLIEKYEAPSKAAVAKVENKVTDNPFLSVAVAFGAGIVIGTVLNYCSKKYSDE